VEKHDQNYTCSDLSLFAILHTDMTTVFRSAWFAVFLGIAGMTVGYTSFLARHSSVAAAVVECPMKKACADGKCDKVCDGKNCEHGCPNCAKNKTS